MIIWLISARTAQEVGTVILGIAGLGVLLIGPIVLSFAVPVVGIPVLVGVYVWLWRGYEEFKDTKQSRKAGQQYDDAIRLYGFDSREAELAGRRFDRAQQADTDAARRAGKKRPPTVLEEEAAMNAELAAIESRLDDSRARWSASVQEQQERRDLRKRQVEEERVSEERRRTEEADRARQLANAEHDETLRRQRASAPGEVQYREVDKLCLTCGSTNGYHAERCRRCGVELQ